MGKSTRTVRTYAKRFHRHRKGKGKKGNHAYPVGPVGKGKGKGKKGKNAVSAMLAEMTDEEMHQAFPSFRGFRSTGKGKGRTGNPKGPDGQQMRCFECGSTSHLAGACPRRQSSTNPTGATTFFAQSSIHSQSVGRLSGIIDDMNMPHTYHVAVTFATHTDDSQPSVGTYRAFMTFDGSTDNPSQIDH